MTESPTTPPAERQPLDLIMAPTPPVEPAMWRDILRWLVAVMDDDDHNLSFAASLLYQCIDRDGLTERQLRYAKPIWNDYRQRYQLGNLGMQRK